MTTLKHHDHHISLTPAARKIVSFLIALVLTTMILFNVLAIAQARAEPMAWGQPLPPQCTSHMEWKSPNVFEAPGCGRPWLDNLVEFWNWFQSSTTQPKK